MALGYEWWMGAEGMGMGDARLLAMIGAFIGWHAVPVSLLMASLLGSVVGLAAIFLLGKDRKLPIPFGPFLAAGSLVSLLHGESLIRWYLEAVGVQ